MVAVAAEAVAADDSERVQGVEAAVEAGDVAADVAVGGEEARGR